MFVIPAKETVGKVEKYVTPAKAGVQKPNERLDARFRGHDELRVRGSKSTVSKAGIQGGNASIVPFQLALDPGFRRGDVLPPDSCDSLFRWGDMWGALFSRLVTLIMLSDIALNPATPEEDQSLLGPWADAFAVVCGSPVVRKALAAEDPGAGQSLTFPRVFQPIELVGGTGHFRHNPAMSEQVQRMGFAWESDGRVLTMPSPSAFNSRLATVGIPGSGFRLSYANGSQAKMPLGPWLLRYMHGVITLLVNAPSFYEPMLRGELPPQLRDRAHWGFTSVAHDISVHALNYHLIPLAAVEELAERIRRAVPERYASWSQPDALAPLTLTYFFDNDFNRYAYAVWCRCQRPQDFAGIFQAPKNFQQLVAALEVRLGETKAGRGDVASGDFNEVRKLADTTFEVL